MRVELLKRVYLGVTLGAVLLGGCVSTVEPEVEAWPIDLPASADVNRPQVEDAIAKAECDKVYTVAIVKKLDPAVPAGDAEVAQHLEEAVAEIQKAIVALGQKPLLAEGAPADYVFTVTGKRILTKGKGRREVSRPTASVSLVEVATKREVGESLSSLLSLDGKRYERCLAGALPVTPSLVVETRADGRYERWLAGALPVTPSLVVETRADGRYVRIQCSARARVYRNHQVVAIRTHQPGQEGEVTVGRGLVLRSEKDSVWLEVYNPQQAGVRIGHYVK